MFQLKTYHIVQFFVVEIQGVVCGDDQRKVPIGERAFETGRLDQILKFLRLHVGEGVHDRFEVSLFLATLARGAFVTVAALVTHREGLHHAMIVYPETGELLYVSVIPKNPKQNKKNINRIL